MGLKMAWVMTALLEVVTFSKRKLRQNMTDNVLTKCDRTFGENGANNGTVVTDTFSFNKESKKLYLT